MTRFYAIVKKEFIQMSRDKTTLLIMALMPLMQTLIFGFAINTDVKHLPAIVFDQSLSQESRELLDSFTATEYYDIKYIAISFMDVNDHIQTGKAKVGIIIPPDYASNIKNERGSQVQVIVDATDSMSATSAINTAQLVGQLKSQEILTKKFNLNGQNINLTKELIDIRIRPWYNPDFITAFYMVPGICATILTLTMILVTSLSIIKEKERGTLEQLMVTPLHSYELMFGKIVPYILMGYVQLTVLLITATFIFKIPFQGSLLLLYFTTGLFIIASLGFGILISNIAKTQMQGMLLSFSCILPSILLSGFMFPREAMPVFFYYLSYLFPITFYLKIIRSIILKGSTIEHLIPEIIALSLFIVIVFSMSVIKFKKRLE